MAEGQTSLVPHQSDQVIVAQLRQDPRLAGLLNVLASADERTPRIPDDIAAALPALIAESWSRIAPLSDGELNDELTGVAGAIGLGSSQREKVEWIAMATITLSRLPGSLVREALREVITRHDRLNPVIKFVTEYCGEYPSKLARRHHRLEQLLNISKDQRRV